MSDEQRGLRELLLNVQHLVAKQKTRLLVERREWLVHQQDLGPKRKRSGDGNALPHAARKLKRMMPFEALQTDMKGLYGDVSEVASERAALAMRSAEEIADRAVALAEEAAGQAKATALEYKQEAQEWADENAEELRGHVRNQPIQSLLIAGGLGVFLGAVFPILLNTYTGIKSVRQNLVDVVRAFGGSPLQIFFKVMIPDATPAIIAGIASTPSQ